MLAQNTILYNWKIGGEAGYGIMNTAGPIFAKTLLRGGFFVFIYSEYPSLIRGGHNTMQVAVSSEPVSGVYSQTDQLVALNWHTIVMHQDEVKKGGVVIYDEGMVKFSTPPMAAAPLKKNKAKNHTCAVGIDAPTMGRVELDNIRVPPLTGTHTVKKAKKETALRQDIKFIPINFSKIAEEAGGDKIMKNVAAVGAALRQFKVQSSRLLSKDNLLEIADEVVADVFAKKGQNIVKANQKALEAGYNLIFNF